MQMVRMMREIEQRFLTGISRPTGGIIQKFWGGPQPDLKKKLDIIKKFRFIRIIVLKLKERFTVVFSFKLFS